MSGAMVDQELPVERLRDYVRGLSPQAQALLLNEIERSLLRAEEIPGLDVVLQELRRSMREHRWSVPRIGTPQRVFFEALEPFLVDGDLDRIYCGRIARGALTPLWTWISRDLVPGEAQRYVEAATGALRAADAPAAQQLAEALREAVALAVRDVLTRLDARSARRLAVQLGTEKAVVLVQWVGLILQERRTLARLAARLPRRIRELNEAMLVEMRGILDPLLPRRDLLALGLVLVLQRLGTPWQLVRLAAHAAGSDDVARIAATPYAAAVTLVLEEIARLAEEATAELRGGRGLSAVGLLKNIHDGARLLQSEIDLPPDCDWGRQLAAIRTAVSAVLTSEIEAAPGRVRRLLRPRAAEEIAPGTALDPLEVEETEHRLGLLEACRPFAAELAVSEVTLRTRNELQHLLDNARHALLEGVRRAGAHDRRFRQSQLEAAVRFCARLFGADYAAVLAKAAGLAAQTERKAQAS